MQLLDSLQVDQFA